MKGAARAVATTRRAGSRRRPKSPPAAGPVVGCLFCREPIEIGSFVPGSLDPRVLSTACPNCGLLVSATTATLAAWSRSDLDSGRVSDLAGRRRALRVANGARAILERVGASELLEEQAG